jgi:hypothetical protein
MGEVDSKSFDAVLDIMADELLKAGLIIGSKNGQRDFVIRIRHLQLDSDNGVTSSYK